MVPAIFDRDKLAHYVRIRGGIDEAWLPSNRVHAFEPVRSRDFA
jgi:hypothetical protein